MAKIIEKAYQPEKFEDEIYKNWEKSGYFRPEINIKTRNSKLETRNLKKPFVIAMPPANVTGKLHIGHALVLTLEDIMARYHRLLGEPTLWLPGTDHAGIATQAVVEKELRKKGTSKNELGREKFVEKVWEWKEEYGSIILNQTRKMGSSCDWSRERFTLDEGLSESVKEAFITLYKRDLIYRKDRVVNWCPKCHTAIADDEVEYKEEKGKFYWIKYGPFILATSRPETKLGDTAVAVHPSDKRYKDMVGKNYKIPGVLGEFEVKVVADLAVDPKFGTGAVKVTPAHSMIDYEIAQRHDIPLKQVIDENGRMMANTGKYAGLTTSQAREAIVEDMKKMGLIDHIDEDYIHNIAICYRCGGKIEPIPSLQWFVKMKPLAEKARKAVESGEIKIIPKRFEKVYFHWLDNIRDWCISRQLWWGHQIPVWYKKNVILNGSEESRSNAPLDPSALPQDDKIKMPQDDKNDKSNICVGVKPPRDIENWTQDEDVLDTWFSSALWPFSTLGWPNETPDFKYFYPTTVMETAYDILFFWVARMIMMGMELTGKVPFETVYLHGLVRDEKNRKMSKSLGNALDPLELIPKYGTDALRMALVVGATAGQDSAVGEAKIKGYRNFSNKIWNASRFVMLRVSEGDLQEGTIGEARMSDLNIDEKLLTEADKKVLRLHTETKKSIKNKLDRFQFSGAGEELYEYFWHQFCDIYIEAAKIQLNNEKTKDNSKKILIKILSETLIMLHPFVPFVTEAIWQELRQIYSVLDDSIMISKWPE
jgi:valyl-tRNA synthetase